MSVDREALLIDALRSATRGKRGHASPCNYSVWDGDNELESGLSRDEAIGFARGLVHASPTYGGGIYNPAVRCGAWVCWPEDRYGELVGEDVGA